MYRKRVGITTKATAVVIVVVLVVLGVAGAYYYFTLPTKPPPGGNITVGFSISQTGTFNVEGGASLNGIKTAAQWINTHGGVIVGGKAYNISLDFYDDASTSSNINNLYAKIVQQDHAQFLLAPYSSGLTAVAAPLAEQFNLIMLSHGGSADTLWTQGYKNLFPLDLALGVHNVLVHHPCCADLLQAVTVTPNQPDQMYPLKYGPPLPARLLVKNAPPEARVLVDGVLVGTAADPRPFAMTEPDQKATVTIGDRTLVVILKAGTVNTLDYQKASP